MKQLKAALPWIGSAALLGWLFWQYDARAAWAALAQADLSALGAVWLGAVLLVFLVDSIGLTVLFSRLNGPITLREMLPIKGASYFLNIVNYAAASGGIAWMVSRRTRAPLVESASSVLFLNVLDLIALNVFVTLGLILDPPGLGDTARSSLIAVNVGLYALYAGSCLYWNGGFNFLIVGRLRTWQIFHAFRQALLSVHAHLLGLRIGLLLVYVSMQYAALNLFGIGVPLADVMVYNSVITLVGTLPISVAGLGTTQVVMLEVYAPYGTEAQILAYSTATIFAFMIARVVIGYRYLRRAQVAIT